jgi:hypothetical protein
MSSLFFLMCSPMFLGKTISLKIAGLRQSQFQSVIPASEARRESFFGQRKILDVSLRLESLRPDKPASGGQAGMTDKKLKTEKRFLQR